jgi:hypothetical protein
MIPELYKEILWELVQPEVTRPAKVYRGGDETGAIADRLAAADRRAKVVIRQQRFQPGLV